MKRSYDSKDLLEYRHLLGIVEEDNDIKRKQRSDKGIERQQYGNIIPNKYRSYIARANKKQLPFSLSIEEFNKLLSMPCSYCGGNNRMTIDRIDNSDGYTIENSTPACLTCNTMKLELSVDSFLRHIKRIHQHCINT